jgi:hypothetical protein
MAPPLTAELPLKVLLVTVRGPLKTFATQLLMAPPNWPELPLKVLPIIVTAVAPHWKRPPPLPLPPGITTLSLTVLLISMRVPAVPMPAASTPELPLMVLSITVRATPASLMPPLPPVARLSLMML